MLDRLDEYFVVINHSITALLHIDVPTADQNTIWVNFWENSGESFHASGELKSFSKSLKRYSLGVGVQCFCSATSADMFFFRFFHSITNISRMMIWLSRIECVKQMFRRFFYAYIDRARDITCNYIHAHEAVVHHKEKLGLEDEDILNHVVCEAVFQIIEAKKVLHNIDEVFPQVVHHLQTMTAARYLLHCEKENVEGYFKTGELEEEEYSALINKLDLSRRKLLTHTKPADTTPNFYNMIRMQDVHSESLGRVRQHILNHGGGATAMEQFLSDIASYGTMVYLRSGELVYAQGNTSDRSFSSLGVYFVARGSTTGVVVPKEVKIQSRSMRDKAYLKQISMLREQALRKLFSIEKMKKNKLKKQQQRQQQEKRLQQRLQQQHSTSGEKGGRVGGALNLATPRKNRPSLSLARSGMSGMSGMDPENDSDVVFDELPEVEQDAYLRHKILSHVNKLKRLAHPGFSGQQSMLRCNNNFFFFGWLFPVDST